MLKTLTFTCLILSSLTAPIIAQNQTFLDISRHLRDETRRSARIEDWQAAQRSNNAALALQPGHAGLLRNAVILADRVGNVETLFQTIDDMAERGLNIEIEGLDHYDALLASDSERLGRLTLKLLENKEAVGHARIAGIAPIKNSQVQALAIDSETERIYLGTVISQQIYTTESHTQKSANIFVGGDGKNKSSKLSSIFSLALDKAQRRLYATTGFATQAQMNSAEPAITELVSIDMETGEIIRRYTIDGAIKMNHVFVRDRIVYVSDTEAKRIYRLSDPQGELEIFCEDHRFGSLQGLVTSRGAVYAADYDLGLWRIDMLTRQAQLLPSPTEASLIGLEGMDVDRKGRIFIIRNGTAPKGLFELELDQQGLPTALTPILVGAEFMGEPSTVRISDGQAFIIADTSLDSIDEDREPDLEQEQAYTYILAASIER